MTEIRTATVVYREGDDVFEGFAAWNPASSARRPGVLVAPDWAGLLEPSREHARRLAAMGYVGFALDVYGQGKRGEPGADNSALMNPLLGDRGLLRRRLMAGAEALRAHEAVDPSRIAATGYCFGGLGVLDLARANQPGLKGVVCLHGIYAPPGLGEQAPIQAKVLVGHGWDDPYTPPAALQGLAAELTAAGADWQVHVYGNTMHAFTNVMANAPDGGVKYNAAADRRSQAAMQDFLAEVLA